MKWGIIGFGKIAKKFTKSITYSDDNQIIAMASKSISSNEEYLLRNPDVTVYQNYQELLEDEQVEAVYIALPHKYHYEWIIKALNAHKAVLCEKPAVLTTEEMRNIKQCAIQNQTCFLEALKTKMNTGFLQLIEDIKLIGQLKTIEANFCGDGRKLKGKSYIFEKGQGGALYDIGSYLLGFVLKVVSSKIIDIKADAKIVDDIDEHFHAYLTFENGCLAHIEGAIDEEKERYALITGDKGSIYIPMFNRISEYTITLKYGEVIHKEYPIVGDDMTYQINVLSDCVKAGKIESELHNLNETVQVIEVMEKIKEKF